MSTDTLRALSQRYAEGGLTRTEYRRRRAALLQGIVAGTIPLKAPPPEEPITETLSGPTLKQIRVREEPTKPARLPARRGNLRWAGLAAAAILIVGTAGYLLTRGPEPAARAPKRSLEPVISSAKPATMPPLIGDFLLHKDWSTEALATLLGQVQSLSGPERSMLARDSGIGRLTDGLYEQLNEERTLMEVDASLTSDARQQTIMDLAAALLIEDPRLTDTAAALAAMKTEQPASPAATAVVTPASTTTAAAATAAATPGEATAAVATTTTPPADVTAPPTATAATEPVPAAAPQTVAEALPPAASTSPAAPPTLAAPEPKAAASPPPGPTTTASKTPTNAAATTSRKRGCFGDLARSRRPFCRDTLRAGGSGPIMVVVPAGEFTMGGAKPSEQPALTARIGYPFAIAAYETTVKEYKAFCTATKRKCPAQPWNADDYPVVNVTLADAHAYAQWLSAQTGQHYRLPSESEWEYAARAGTKTRYPFGDELLPTHARFSYSGPVDSPLPVSDKSINRNRFRLYHMLGNVREWVADAWHESLAGAPTDGSARGKAGATGVVRGGSYRNGAEQLGSAARQGQPADQADTETGFRVAIDFRANETAARGEGPAALAARN